MNSLEHVVFVLRIAVERGEITKRELLEYLGELMGAVGEEWQPMAGIEGTMHGPPSQSEKLNQKISKRFQSLMYPSGLDTDDESELPPMSPTRHAQRIILQQFDRLHAVVTLADLERVFANSPYRRWLTWGIWDLKTRGEIRVVTRGTYERI